MCLVLLQYVNRKWVIFIKPNLSPNSTPLELKFVLQFGHPLIGPFVTRKSYRNTFTNIEEIAKHVHKKNTVDLRTSSLLFNSSYMYFFVQ